MQGFYSMWTMNVQAGLSKGRATRDQMANIRWIIEKAREFQKNIYFCFIDYAKAFAYVDHKKLRKILQEMGIPDHLTCMLRNLYAGQEATVRTGHGTTDWFQIGEEVRQGCILSLCLFNLHAQYIVTTSVVMYRCESWTITNAECQRMNSFELWCWRRLLAVPWTARRSNQSILKKINPEYSPERLMLKLKLQYFGHLMQRADSLEKKDPDAGKDWKQEKGTTEDEMVGWHHWLNGHEFEQALGVGNGQGSLMFCSPWGPKESDTNEQLNTSELSDLTEHDYTIKWYILKTGF